MQVLTAMILAAFVAYGGSWYMGMLEGNFALLLFTATFVTGLYWLAERFYFLPQRQKAAAELEANALNIRTRAQGELGALPVAEVVERVAAAIAAREDF